MKFSCVRCSKQFECIETSSLSKIRETTGLRPILTASASSVWICPDCLEIIRPAIETLEGIFGKQAIWISIISLIKKDPSKSV